MRRLKRIVLLVALGFLAFAPPGTLVVTALIVAGVFGTGWALVAGAGILATAVLIWLARRRRRSPSRP